MAKLSAVIKRKLKVFLCNLGDIAVHYHISSVKMGIHLFLVEVFISNHYFSIHPQAL